MAVLCLLHFPFATRFSTLHSQSSSSLSSLHKFPLISSAIAILPPFPSLSTFSFLSPLSLTLPHKSHKPKSYFFHAFSSAQYQATVEIPILEPTETGEDEKWLEAEEDEASRTRLLAQNVPWTSTADDLRTVFEKYGTVVKIELSMHNKIRNRGLAFVTMGSHEEALAALNNVESYEFEGRPLKLNWARPKKKPTPPQQPKPVPIHNLFVGNLPFQARAKDLKDFFNANNANAVSAHVIFLDNPRKSAGYGFVSFNTKKEADEALSSFEGKEFMGRQIRVAQSRKFRRQETKESVQSEMLQED